MPCAVAMLITGARRRPTPRPSAAAGHSPGRAEFEQVERPAAALHRAGDTGRQHPAARNSTSSPDMRGRPLCTCATNRAVASAFGDVPSSTTRVRPSAVALIRLRIRIAGSSACAVITRVASKPGIHSAPEMHRVTDERRRVRPARQLPAGQQQADRRQRQADARQA